MFDFEDTDCPELLYFMNEAESDITFIVEGQRLPALKSLLMLKSRVFRAMFRPGFKESTAKEIEIKDTNFQSFKSMLRFIYCDQLVVDPKADRLTALVDLAKLGHLYGLNKLMKYIEEVSLHLISNETIEFLYQLGLEYNMNKLMDRLKSSIVFNYDYFKNKDIEELKTFNANTDNSLFEIMVKKLRSAEQVFSPLIGKSIECHNIRPRSPSTCLIAPRSSLERMTKFDFNRINRWSFGGNDF